MSEVNKNEGLFQLYYYYVEEENDDDAAWWVSRMIIINNTNYCNFNIKQRDTSSSCGDGDATLCLLIHDSMILSTAAGAVEDKASLATTTTLSRCVDDDDDDATAIPLPSLVYSMRLKLTAYCTAMNN